MLCLIRTHALIIILADFKFGDFSKNSPIHRIKNLAKVSHYTVHVIMVVIVGQARPYHNPICYAKTQQNK